MHRLKQAFEHKNLRRLKLAASPTVSKAATYVNFPAGQVETGPKASYLRDLSGGTLGFYVANCQRNCFPRRGVGVHRQTLVFLLFTNLFVALASAQPNDSNAVNCTQFMAWTAGGVSSQRLARLVQQRGISFLLDAP